MSLVVNIYFDKILTRFLCLFALFVPLEHILEVFFGIDTVFKPYRIFAILIILTFVIRSCFKWTRNSEINQDIFLYTVFLYGVFITLLRMIITNFDMGLFANDAFQLSLYLGVFFVLRHLPLNRVELSKILNYLLAGITFNCGYFFYRFFFEQLYDRNGGMMDNPNYMAFSASIAIIFFIIQMGHTQGLIKRLLFLAAIFFFGYVIVIGGSRTAFVVLVLSLGAMLYLAPGKARGALFAIFMVFCGFLVFGGWNIVEKAGPVILAKRLNKDQTKDNRMPIWAGVIRGAESVNYAGLGVGQFKANFRDFYESENNDLITRITENDYFLSPHSDYLAMLAIYGIIGLLGYLIFLFLSLKKVYKRYYETIFIADKKYFQFTFLVLVSLVFFGLTNENTFSGLFWILLAISTKVGLIESSKQKS